MDIGNQIILPDPITILEKMGIVNDGWQTSAYIVYIAFRWTNIINFE